MSEKNRLHDSLRKLVLTYGQDIYKNSKLINYLNDYCHFDPPALYHIMKTVLSDGYASKLLDESKNKDWSIFVQQSIGKLQKQYGFQGIFLNYCFQSLAFGIGLFPAINQRLLDEVEGRLPVFVPQPMPKQSQPNSGQQNANQQVNQRQPDSKQQPTIQKQKSPQPPYTRKRTYPPGWVPRSTNTNTNIPFPQNQIPPTNNPSTSNSFYGCGSGCFDDISSIFSIIIFILWILVQCS